LGKKYVVKLMVGGVAMMLGGSMMLLFGSLIHVDQMVGLPVLLIVAAVAGVWGLSDRRSGSAASLLRNDRPVLCQRSLLFPCGRGLENRWTHSLDNNCTGLIK
jgi:hypothetical protein